MAPTSSAQRWTLLAGAAQRWSIVADVNQDAQPLGACSISWRTIGSRWPACWSRISPPASAELLSWIVAAADGLQHTADNLSTAHHFANVAFNVMRGGHLRRQRPCCQGGFARFRPARNTLVASQHARRCLLGGLPDPISVGDLSPAPAATGVPDLNRLCHEYLPLTFSRRHGDPSRPWNRFSINLATRTASRSLDYEGNWRDIFQNWEALAWSFPASRRA